MVKNISLNQNKEASFVIYENSSIKREIFTCIQRNIEITLSPVHIVSQSTDQAQVWIYKLCIQNLRKKPIQLIGMYYQLTESYGLKKILSTQNPFFQKIFILPRESFKYMGILTSMSSQSIFLGQCTFQDSRKNSFGIDIPKVFLDTEETKVNLK
jgi:uncharacterized protein affecting Mg2+/Co2+ transport